MRLASLVFAVSLVTAASGFAETPAHPQLRQAIVALSATQLREFGLMALRRLKGPAQRPFLKLLNNLPPTQQIGVTISARATKNMQCSGGVCTPTATKATLNVSDLTRLLVDGSVTIGTSAQAPDIFVNAPFSWANGNSLTLQAIGNIVVNKAVQDAGTAPLSLTYNANGAGGTLSFGSKGHISFASTGNALTINGRGYILANNIQTLAQLIARNPSGNFALSANYNAWHDGKYTQSPIQTVFQGNFEGLGNKIMALHVESENGDQPTGFFGEVDVNAHVQNFALTSAQIDVFGSGKLVSGLGGIVGDNKGTLLQDSFSGTVSVPDCNGAVAGLAGFNDGQISFSHSDGNISAVTVEGETCWVGGLVGLNAATQAAGIVYSYSTASTSFSGPNGSEGYVGGLAGATAVNDYIVATIAHTFATGSAAVTGGPCSCIVGGLIGENPELGSISDSSASGPVNGVDGLDLGGLLGSNVYGNVTNSVATGAVSGGQNCACGGALGTNGNGGNNAILVVDTTSYGSISAGAGSLVGGFVGWDLNPGDLSGDGWCTTSSGFGDIHHGAGDPADDPGITPFTC